MLWCQCHTFYIFNLGSYNMSDLCSLTSYWRQSMREGLAYWQPIYLAVILKAYFGVMWFLSQRPFPENSRLTTHLIFYVYFNSSKKSFLPIFPLLERRAKIPRMFRVFLLFICCCFFLTKQIKTPKSFSNVKQIWGTSKQKESSLLFFGWWFTTLAAIPVLGATFLWGCSFVFMLFLSEGFHIVYA